jgi:DNA-binding MarR family transcriptional regulator
MSSSVSATTPPAQPTAQLPAELTSRLRLAITRLARRLRQQAEGDVTPSQQSALATILHRGPLTLGALATIERVQPPSMTRIVSSLEEQGLVRRDTDANDRRVARVQVTADGRRLVERNRSRKNAYLARRLGQLTAEEVAVIEQAVALLERVVEDER